MDDLAHIDAEIERLRQTRPKDEADPKCVEIDTAIRGLEWLRDKFIKAGGPQVFMGIGIRGELVGVQAMREEWAKHQMYRAVPEGVHATLHVLARAAQHARSLEDAQALAAKLIEVLEFVWPIGTVQEHTALSVGKVAVLVPKIL